MITFDDAVTAANLPGQKYGVFYMDAAYANEAAVRARLGKDAILAGITATGKTGKLANFLDFERGDVFEIAQAVAWVDEQIRLGIDLLGVYASLDSWHNGLWAALEKYGNRIKRWCAAYDQDPSLTLVYEGVTYTFDAHQWAGNVAPGVDKNVASASFFTPWKPAKPAAKVPPRPAQTKTASKPVWQLEQIKDRLRRVRRRLVPTRFGGFRP